MKKLLMLTLIIFMGVSGPNTFTSEVNAQTKERVVKRKKKRKVRRRTRRRVRRRVARRAHFRYRNLPKYRTVVLSAPSGSVIVTKGSNTYRYHKGIYYRKGSNGFVIIRPARGIRIRRLPVGHRVVVSAGRNYYYYYGTFYSAVGDEYEVIDAPEGAVVDALPEGYEVVTKNDQEYYLLDGVHYQEVEDNDLEDKVGYEVVVL